MLEALVGTLPAKVQPYAKTYTAALVTALIVVTSSIDAPKWLTITLAVFTSPLVFAMPNLDPKGQKQDESVQPPDAGLGHRQVVKQTYTVNPATPEGEPVIVESAGPDYPIAQDFVGGTTPPTTEPDKGGYWGGV